MALRTLAIILSVIGLSFLYSCNEEGECVKNTGKVVKEDRAAIDFHYLEIYDNINVILTQDTMVHAITVEAGENLIAGITTEIDSGRLTLRNQNSCNWLRSFEVPVNVYLTFSKLDTIVFQASGDISCSNTWHNDSIYLNVVEGAGDINLRLNVARSTMHIRYGTVSLTVNGKSGVTFISSQGYGPVHAEELLSKFTYVYTYSPNDVYVYAEEEIGVEIANIGNVYCKGNPKEVSEINSSTGRLIQY